MCHYSLVYVLLSSYQNLERLHFNRNKPSKCIYSAKLFSTTALITDPTKVNLLSLQIIMTQTLCKLATVANPTALLWLHSRFPFISYVRVYTTKTLHVAVRVHNYIL